MNFGLVGIVFLPTMTTAYDQFGLDISERTTEEIEQTIMLKSEFGKLSEGDGPLFCKELLTRKDASAQPMISCMSIVDPKETKNMTNSTN
jgi:hypothetical protein